MTITESQLASLHERHAAQQDEIIKRLMEKIDHMNEEVRLLNEENRKMTDELKNNPPVIRCKECKHLSLNVVGMKNGACKRRIQLWYGDSKPTIAIEAVPGEYHYCGYAEMKEDFGDENMGETT